MITCIAFERVEDVVASLVRYHLILQVVLLVQKLHQTASYNLHMLGQWLCVGDAYGRLSFGLRLRLRSTQPQPTATPTVDSASAYGYAHGRLSLTRLRLSPGGVPVFDSAEPRLDPTKARKRSRSTKELKAKQ